MLRLLPQLQRFIYSHHFLGGLRQAVGVLLPVLILGGLFEAYAAGVVAALGAACVAIIDQPGGPRRYRINEMLGGVALGTLTVAITGLAANSVWGVWIVVPLLCFSLSMLNVYGLRGGLMGFACLLLMAVTLPAPMRGYEWLAHTFMSFVGAMSYFCFSLLFRRLFWLSEERRTLAMALYATAEYAAARACFYNPRTELDTSYRQLIKAQSDMTMLHQAARDIVLRELPRGKGRGDQERAALLSVYTNMVSLLDTLVATHTDYATLRRQLGNSDFMEFAYSGVQKLSHELQRIALNVIRHRKRSLRISLKPELRAMEYELERYKNKGLNTENPELYVLLVQILRRLRVASSTLTHMAEHTHRTSLSLPIDQHLDKSLSRFLTREEIHLGALRSNLTLSSSAFRYSLRVTAAALIALGIPLVINHFYHDTETLSILTNHSHWIFMTTIIIMKPGFALTRQRNLLRLFGTALGCALSYILFELTANKEIYFVGMIAAYILANSLNQLNYLLSAMFSTVFILIGFQFLYGSSNMVISERLFDTLVGSCIALVCSYILPQWEASSLDKKALDAINANREFLSKGLSYANLKRQLDQVVHLQNTATPELQEAVEQLSPEDLAQLEAELNEAETQWQLARRDINVAFDNFAQSFYRMMSEPTSHQRNVSLMNNLLIQNHILASQISTAVPLLAHLPTVPVGVDESLSYVQGLLAKQRPAPPASTIESEGELAMLIYPLKQMIKAAQLIQQDMRGIMLADGPIQPNADSGRRNTSLSAVDSSGSKA